MLSNVILATLCGVCFTPFTGEKTQARQWWLHRLPEKLYSHKQSRAAQTERQLERKGGGREGKRGVKREEKKGKKRVRKRERKGGKKSN